MTEQRKRSHWYSYDGKPVFIQLRDTYVGVTYPNQLVTQRQRVQTEQGDQVVESPVAIPFLRGILHVHEGERGGALLVLETEDPNPNQNARAEIVLQPDDVLYMTYLEKRLVERA